ncbi:MAG: putative 7-carboxy-7-deazaguanine synthase QueE [Eubacterium sp.]|nr:putative 7-carboxy-7-deazaguanine synthase QueE [Eubacterium sp.]
MTEFKVVEKFISINGEAARAGELSVFIRFKGCNLRCNYCDTLWACEDGAEYSLMNTEDIYEYIKASCIKNVTLTGGEPMLQEGIGELLQRLGSDTDLRIEVETNGAVPLTDYYRSVPDNVSFTVDYKCAGSGMEKAMYLPNFEGLRSIDTVKFVVSDIIDLDKAAEVIEKYRLSEKCPVYLSAVFGRITPEEIVEYMKDNKLNDIRLQLQMHKYIWPPEMKGV